MQIFSRTDVGKERNINEDSIYTTLSEGVGLLVIADGMGGHNAGDVASKMVVDRIAKDIAKVDPTKKTKRVTLLEQAIKSANEDVFSLANTNKSYHGMGTTVIAAMVDEEQVTMVHAGDSRGYILDASGLRQITEDHSYVNVLLKHGEITANEARSHPQRNMIVSAVGTTEHVTTDAIELEWVKNDILLLCSDGLTTELEEMLIKEILTNTNLSLNEKGNCLIEKALENGGKDNVSVILVEN
ncbi:MAG: hypothetical protein RLZ12_1051 [Bacillota bacterium]|jgi:protein phosphatase